MTANKPMTGEQLDELMTVAVNFQRESEKAGERAGATFAYAVQVAVLELRKVRDDLAVLAAENAALKDFVKTCFRAAGDGASLDGADIQELGERLGLFGRETYQPVLHGYICGHEAGEDSVYVMKETPATDAFLAEVRASALPADVMAAIRKVARIRLDLNDFDGDKRGIVDCLSEAEESLVEVVNKFAAQLRQGGAV